MNHSKMKLVWGVLILCCIVSVFAVPTVEEYQQKTREVRIRREYKEEQARIARENEMMEEKAKEVELFNLIVSFFEDKLTRSPSYEEVLILLKSNITMEQYNIIITNKDKFKDALESHFQGFHVFIQQENSYPGFYVRFYNPFYHIELKLDRTFPANGTKYIQQFLENAKTFIPRVEQIRQRHVDNIIAKLETKFDSIVENDGVWDEKYMIYGWGGADRLNENHDDVFGEITRKIHHHFPGFVLRSRHYPTYCYGSQCEILYFRLSTKDEENTDDAQKISNE